MEPDKVSFIINYTKFGTRPPVFVAGTFTDPEWTPQEMQHTTGTDGELLFRAQIFVVPGKEYQYKFRLGEGDWWALDENYPIVNDDAGNQNNLLSVPSAPRKSSQVSFANQSTPPVSPPNKASTSPALKSKPNFLAANLASELEVQADSGTPTPVAEAASKTVEVPSVAPSLDAGKVITPPLKIVDMNREAGIHEPSDSLRTPLFAHESFGAYDFVDDGFDHDSVGDSNQRRFSKSIKESFLSSDMDLEDPTLEKFPSDRTSIFDALRKIQTTLDDDVIQADVPWGASYDSSSRTSLDSADDLTLSPCSLSPTSTRRRDSRHSHSSVGRNRSAVSLGSIAEEDQNKGAAQTKPKHVQTPNSGKADKVSDKSMGGSQKEEDDNWLTISSAKTGQSGKKDNSAQPRSFSKKSGKSKKTGLEDSDARSGSGNRHGSYPRFITNVFEDSRTK